VTGFVAKTFPVEALFPPMSSTGTAKVKTNGGVKNALVQRKNRESLKREVLGL